MQNGSKGASERGENGGALHIEARLLGIHTELHLNAKLRHSVAQEAKNGRRHSLCSQRACLEQHCVASKQPSWRRQRRRRRLWRGEAGCKAPSGPNARTTGSAPGPEAAELAD